MAYNEMLAGRIRAALAHVPKVEEKKMFGSLAFMVNNKMCITAGADRIMCRINPDMHEELISRQGCRPVIMRGRELKGYVHVDENSIRKERDFDYWIQQVLDYNSFARPQKSRRK